MLFTARIITFDDAATWEEIMESAGIGWIAAIIIGGVAGWLAEQFMKSNMGVFMNILLGIVGAIVANAILSVFGIVLTGWLGYLIAGFIGACILILIGRAFRRG
ncbi:putative membrane protein YeaQ/YmgE (transglycosylase-associated protein family) [Agrobacterium tumefaciens]|nr:putative membrane protein YeaQ/YmgE (transglycosylase-associated protein family) [Agrobacterium radiobacter]MBB5585751.1 putative membrane protein YeaQ/YmgE (transglycosylase-associated protein family) [Agrobacterium radiobacter]